MSMFGLAKEPGGTVHHLVNWGRGSNHKQGDIPQTMCELSPVLLAKVPTPKENWEIKPQPFIDIKSVTCEKCKAKLKPFSEMANNLQKKE